MCDNIITLTFKRCSVPTQKALDKNSVVNIKLLYALCNYCRKTLYFERCKNFIRNIRKRNEYCPLVVNTSVIAHFLVGYCTAYNGQIVSVKGFVQVKFGCSQRFEVPLYTLLFCRFCKLNKTVAEIIDILPTPQPSV